MERKAGNLEDEASLSSSQEKKRNLSTDVEYLYTYISLIHVDSCAWVWWLSQTVYLGSYICRFVWIWDYSKDHKANDPSISIWQLNLVTQGDIQSMSYSTHHHINAVNCHFTVLMVSLTPFESNDPGLALNFTVFRRARSFLSTLPSKEQCQSLTRRHEITHAGTGLNYKTFWHTGWQHVSNTVWDF